LKPIFIISNPADSKLTNPAFDVNNPPLIGATLTYTCFSNNYLTVSRSLTTVTVTCLDNNAYSDPIGNGTVSIEPRLVPFSSLGSKGLGTHK
jgi:hypothetical protein